MHPKDAEGIANSVDPDQSDLGLHCLPRPAFPKTLDNYGILDTMLHGKTTCLYFRVVTAICVGV